MPSVARIHFVRHAETLFNVNRQLQGWCDSPLTERGERQVAALGEWMRGVPLTAAFMSDLTRTRTTMAGALVGHPNLEPVPMTALREWHYGGWEGQPNPDMWTPVYADHGLTYKPGSGSWPTLTTDGFDHVIDSIHAHDPLGRAETSAQVRARVETAFETILAEARSGSGDVIVVTHGTMLGSLLRHLVPTNVSPPSGYPNCGVVTATVTWPDADAPDAAASAAALSYTVTLADVDGSNATPA